MTALEDQSVRYITVRTKRYAFVKMSQRSGNECVDWIETLEDLQVFRQATAELEAAGDINPEQAGWLRWDDIRTTSR